MSVSVGYRWPITQDWQEVEEVKSIQTEGAQLSNTKLEAKETWFFLFIYDLFIYLFFTISGMTFMQENKYQPTREVYI